ncbi:uncharacterized protein LOC106135725 [Amyelois transitella]|uniref:uncharacterized protein LOC106135725 n=1 Tax=Amyelois transitella TaxID=680683 RepID=UPI00067BDF89|nr:uncharacterized protein LOC106135725 [Amyelois transitella]
MDKVMLSLSKLMVSTKEISPEVLQAILIQAKKHTANESCQEWNELCDLLYKHLHTGLPNYDDQLLCATCFFSVLLHTENSDYYLNNINLEITKELDLREKNNEEDIKNNSRIAEVVSVMYGLFQSPFLTQTLTTDSKYIGAILKSSFNLLLLLAYEYSRFTYLAFKTINSYKKVLGTMLQEHIFNATSQVMLLNLVNHNWENPITGIRDLNKGIFRMVISNTPEEMFEVIFKEVNSFYWNKAKYLMLSEIIEIRTDNIQKLATEYGWVNGLMYSLHKPGLVSAGADMYFAILKKLKFDDEWCDLFLKGLIEILTADTDKAIQNFTNYWCSTTFKKMPSLAQTIIGQLGTEKSVNKEFSTLCLMKQANKLGLLKKDWNCEAIFPKDLMLHALESCNTSIRIQAFDIICVSHSKIMPELLEYNVILSYVHDNMNSDCTVLRLSMLNSLSNFLTRLQSNYMTNSNTMSDKNVTELMYFCKELQKCIVQSLSLNGNYQRKIASVKLCKLVQDCFCNPPRKLQNHGSRTKALTLSLMLKMESGWILDEKTFLMKLLSLLHDPSDDIREHVVSLLLSHYSKEFKCPLLLNQVIDDAHNSIRSKFFYNISCGRTMFKFITNILLIEESTAKFKNVEDIFLFAYNNLVTEFKLKTNIVKSIESGKQLHSLISILLVVLEVCYQNSYKLSCLVECFTKLVLMLEEISNQFAWEDTSTSSDFSKMSDMVQCMIASSGYDPDDEKDETKISGLHQIVLNCLWLNVKVSCDLASQLVQFTEDVELIDRCLKIITRVLETCRHKGAIEAAGAAIGRSIHYLTSLPDESSISQLPYTLLKKKLKDLILEAGAMSSVTRRGAGLSIMVHRIVSNDMKRGKPLFHYFMATLLEACNKAGLVPEESNIDNQKDLPQAIYIHFLTRIVTDSSLASDMMYYSAKLAALAFGNLTSPRWQIRNAALQLYGALIPKLIGQKKASGKDDETVATVACDEFRTHSPALWTHITQSLEASSNTLEVQSHSNLVPILNILGNIARRYNFSSNIETHKHSDENLLKCLILLLHSPLYIIRRLTVKCIFNLFSFEDMYDVIITQDINSENFLHGILVLLTVYKKQDNDFQLFYQNENFGKLKVKLERIMNSGEHSYLCRQLFEDIIEHNYEVKDICNTIMEIKSNSHSPGVHLWSERRIEKYVRGIPWTKVPEILEILLKNKVDYGSVILSKFKSDKIIPKDVLLKISDQLLVYSIKWNSAVIWEILYEISLIEKIENVDVNIILTYIKENVSYKLRFAIPFAVRVSRDIVTLNVLSDIVLNLSDPEKMDTDMRYISALANNEIAFHFEILPDDTKINAITSAVVLSQDEDESIRSLNVKFYTNIKSGHAINPYIYLHKITGITFLISVFENPQKSIKKLCEKLKSIYEIKPIDSDEYNPFANDSKNIYCEVEVVRQLIEKLRYA